MKSEQKTVYSSKEDQASLARQIRDQADNELILQHEQIQQELQMAADFQQAVLPAIVDLSYLEMAITYRPYATVSGDVYDFLQNREGDLSIFLGDATGHGIAAALLTMMIHIGLDGIRRDLATDESIRILNKLIAMRKTGRSVSGVFFRITSSGYLTVTHAGHPSIIIIPANGDALVQFSDGGCALGIFEEEPVRYSEESYQLAVGDKVLAYTDAVIEWRNPNKEKFELPQLLETLTLHRHESVDDMSCSLTSELEKFSEGHPCGDDLTTLIMEYAGVKDGTSW